MTAQNLGPFDPITGLPFGFQQVFLRGEAQTNTAVRLSQSLFDKIGDLPNQPRYGGARPGACHQRTVSLDLCV